MEPMVGGVGERGHQKLSGCEQNSQVHVYIELEGDMQSKKNLSNLRK